MAPGQIASSRNERQPRAISLDKIRNYLYMLLLTESLPARRRPGPSEEKPRLFENRPHHNPPREL
jgi:hypothetical protein